MTEQAKMQAALAEIDTGGSDQEPCLFIYPTRASCMVYLKHATSSCIIRSAPDWREAIAAAKEAAEAALGARDETLIKNMALDIIRITHESGTCSDAQLRRMGAFIQAEIIRVGEAAVALANKMAGNRPYTLTVSTGENIGSAA